MFWSKSREMTEAIKATMKAGPEASVIEIRDWASRATLDIIGVAGMGQDFNALADPNNELNNTYKAIFAANRNQQLMQVLLGLLPEW